ncbi:DUF3492 domain-containing protein [Streptomyces netropsis]|uniref:D-inositol 3-phosphate glycosyltransferase n=1 Tax=Streptomyces netropsis TaxID=55404 RepID=A0A7W7LA88_STRNE|nr:DUF3492 domain-containing protein [Streptomyces netropsis]MBB4885946.1 glycosyltransferase involved in cell wall biosynthesis [Streptomyces netropsis]
MRVGLLTEGGYPYTAGEGGRWCERLVRGLDRHDFEIYALSRGAGQERGGQCELPGHVRRVRTAPLWGEPAARAGARAYGAYGRRERRAFDEHFGELVAAISSPGPLASTDLAYRFADGLYGLAELARDIGGLAGALRSEQALRALERACRAPGAHPAAYGTRVADLLLVSALLERALRPLSLDWYGASGGATAGDDRGLAGVDLCHATSGGAAALPGLLAKRFFGTPLLVTEYGVRLRAHYLLEGGAGLAADRTGEPGGAVGAGLSLAVRTLLSAFHRRLAAEIYDRAALVTHGDARDRRWQERCGADHKRLRTVHPGIDPSRYDTVGEGVDRAGAARTDDGRTLVWVGGRPEPALWQALAELREAEPDVRLRVVGPPDPGPPPDSGPAADLAPAVSFEETVSFEEAGDPDVYASASVVVLAGSVDGFPAPLVEAMLCGRATVSPDVGVVRDVIGGTGPVVAPGDAKALAEACLALLRDPERRARLGAAARARALELFTVGQNVAAYHGIYLEVLSRAPVRQEPPDPSVPFAHAADAHPPLPWSRSTAPTWAGRP